MLAGKYRLGALIGQGAFGSVYQALDSHTGELLAVKKVVIPKYALSEVKSEVNSLRRLAHPHIVRYMDEPIYDAQARCLYICMEFMEGGSLAGMVESFGPLNSTLARKYFLQTLRGLEYLHAQGVIHRDIKGKNILLAKMGLVKLADFGCAFFDEDAEEQDNGGEGGLPMLPPPPPGTDRTDKGGAKIPQVAVAGSPFWMAPEVIQLASTPTAACDIWSLGCTVVELLTGKPPYYDLEPMSALYRICTDENILDSVTLPSNDPTLRDFLEACLNRDPSQRASAIDLLCSTFITGTPSRREGRRSGGGGSSNSSSGNLASASEPGTAASRDGGVGNKGRSFTTNRPYFSAPDVAIFDADADLDGGPVFTERRDSDTEGTYLTLDFPTISRTSLESALGRVVELVEVVCDRKPSEQSSSAPWRGRRASTVAGRAQEIEDAAMLIVTEVRARPAIAEKLLKTEGACLLVELFEAGPAGLMVANALIRCDPGIKHQLGGVGLVRKVLQALEGSWGECDEEKVQGGGVSLDPYAASSATVAAHVQATANPAARPMSMLGRFFGLGGLCVPATGASSGSGGGVASTSIVTDPTPVPVSNSLGSSGNGRQSTSKPLQDLSRMHLEAARFVKELGVSSTGTGQREGLKLLMDSGALLTVNSLLSLHRLLRSDLPARPGSGRLDAPSVGAFRTGVGAGAGAGTGTCAGAGADTATATGSSSGPGLTGDDLELATAWELELGLGLHKSSFSLMKTLTGTHTHAQPTRLATPALAAPVPAAAVTSDTNFPRAAYILDVALDYLVRLLPAQDADKSKPAAISGSSGGEAAHDVVALRNAVTQLENGGALKCLASLLRHFHDMYWRTSMASMQMSLMESLHTDDPLDDGLTGSSVASATRPSLGSDFEDELMEGSTKHAWEDMSISDCQSDAGSEVGNDMGTGTGTGGGHGGAVSRTNSFGSTASVGLGLVDVAQTRSRSNSDHTETSEAPSEGTSDGRAGDMGGRAASPSPSLDNHPAAHRGSSATGGSGRRERRRARLSKGQMASRRSARKVATVLAVLAGRDGSTARALCEGRPATAAAGSEVSPLSAIVYCLRDFLLTPLPSRESNGATRTGTGTGADAGMPQKDHPLMDYIDVIELMLRCVRGMTTHSSLLDPLAQQDIIPTLVRMLALVTGLQGVTPTGLGRKSEKKIRAQCLPALYNMCRLHKRRQEWAAREGLIPSLVEIVESRSSSVRYALPLLCDLAHTSDGTRELLHVHGGVELFADVLHPIADKEKEKEKEKEKDVEREKESERDEDKDKVEEKVEEKEKKKDRKRQSSEGGDGDDKTSSVAAWRPFAINSLAVLMSADARQTTAALLGDRTAEDVATGGLRGVDKLSAYVRDTLEDAVSGVSKSNSSQVLHSIHRPFLEMLERSPALCGAMCVWQDGTMTRALVSQLTLQNQRGQSGTGAIVTRSLLRALQLLCAAHPAPSNWAAKHGVLELLARLEQDSAHVLTSQSAGRLIREINALATQAGPAVGPGGAVVSAQHSPSRAFMLRPENL